jgi:deazaflavin-dependent oxidoreductase (nitroreductase family)
MYAVGMSGPGRWFGINVSSRIDPALLRISGGRLATTWFFPLVLMTARGRRSGEPRTVPLVYFTQGHEVILTASSFGRAKHPDWYLNVKANPSVELICRGGRGRYLARETEGEERDRLFDLSTQLYGGYGLYQERTDRTIPVLALRPER